jgi:hypothetical protein
LATGRGWRFPLSVRSAAMILLCPSCRAWERVPRAVASTSRCGSFVWNASFGWRDLGGPLRAGAPILFLLALSTGAMGTGACGRQPTGSLGPVLEAGGRGGETGTGGSAAGGAGEAGRECPVEQMPVPSERQSLCTGRELSGMVRVARVHTGIRDARLVVGAAPQGARRSVAVFGTATGSAMLYATSTGFASASVPSTLAPRDAVTLRSGSREYLVQLAKTDSGESAIDAFRLEDGTLVAESSVALSGMSELTSLVAGGEGGALVTAFHLEAMQDGWSLRRLRAWATGPIFTTVDDEVAPLSEATAPTVPASVGRLLAVDRGGGKIDVLVGARKDDHALLLLFRSQGPGYPGWWEATDMGNIAPTQLTVADTDGDGVDDVLVSTMTGVYTVSAWAHPEQSAVQIVTGSAWDADAADFDDDGVPELLVASREADLGLYSQVQRIDRVARFTTGAQSVRVVDLDGNARPEVVASDIFDAGNVFVLRPVRCEPETGQLLCDGSPLLSVGSTVTLPARQTVGWGPPATCLPAGNLETSWWTAVARLKIDDATGCFRLSAPGSVSAILVLYPTCPPKAVPMACWLWNGFLESPAAAIGVGHLAPGEYTIAASVPGILEDPPMIELRVEAVR